MKALLIGCLSLVLMAIVAIGLGVAWLFIERPTLDGSLDMPLQVTVGETFHATITASNGHDKTVTLDSIDISDTLLAGVQISSIEPDPESTTRVPVLDQRSWAFNTPVEPGATMTVRYTLRAVREGHFTGDIDLCNPSQDFFTLYGDLVIVEGE